MDWIDKWEAYCCFALMEQEPENEHGEWMNHRTHLLKSVPKSDQ